MEGEIHNLHHLRGEFSQIVFQLDETQIRRLNDQNIDGYLNNTIIGLNDDCFGILVNEDNTTFSYQLFYVNNSNDLNGYLLELMIDNPNRENLVFMFANMIVKEYTHLDSIDVFNTFQFQTRSALEKVNYFTVTSLELKKTEGKNGTLVAKGVRGIIILNLINKIDFLREYFSCSYHIKVIDGESYVYVMLNERNGLTKIGMSTQPAFREKTLQSQEPEIHLLACWKAPAKVERELHRMFASNRQRGEWFKLTAKEFGLIKDRMNEFNQL